MADEEPRSGELTTANYGWVKPNVGNSDDAWGGMLNADLDGIDTTVKSVSNVANAAYPASNPSGYQTAANVTTSLAPYALTASVPVASTAAPIMDSVAAAGTGTTWARADHVHPLAFQVIGDNRLINGDMRIDQRNNGASGTANGYTVDRWQCFGSVASKGTWQRGTTVGLPFPYSLQFTSLSAYTPAAAEIFQLTQPIEADMVSDFQWGTANAQPVTLSFWVLCSLVGTLSGSILNYAATRSYPFTFSNPVANTWTKIVLTIPGDTAGTWVSTGNAGSMFVSFDLGSGSTRRGPANAWALAAYYAATGSVSVVAVNGAIFYVTGVKLEIGSVATPFNRQSLAKSMADCQRYYQVMGGGMGGVFYATTACQLGGSFPVSMRATPTLNLLTATPTVNVPGVSNPVASGSTSGASVLTFNGMAATLLGFTGQTVGAVCFGVTIGIWGLSAEV